MTQVAAGSDFVVALRSDGTVLAWGDNTMGQLGNGTMSPTTAPAPVSGLSGVTAVAAGTHHGVALRSAATVWAWGDDSQGQLGVGRLGAPIATPAEVLSAQYGNPLTAVSAIAAGGDHSIAIDPSPGNPATLFDWGKHYDATPVTNCIEAMPRDADTEPLPVPVPAPIPASAPVDAKVGGPNQDLYLYRSGGATNMDFTPRPPTSGNPEGDVKPWGQNGLPTWWTVIQACYRADGTTNPKQTIQVIRRLSTDSEPDLSSIDGLGIVPDPRSSKLGHFFLFADQSEAAMDTWAATRPTLAEGGMPDMLTLAITAQPGPIFANTKCPLTP